MSTRITNYASFIIFLLIFTMQTNAQKSITGVITEEISTKDGKFLLHRTTHLPKGKSISGTVTFEPESDKTKKREKQIENLKRYILKIGDQIISNDGIFTMKLPDTDNIPLQVLTSEGKLVQEIPFELSEPLIPENLKMPKTIRKDFAEKITGDFSGDISNANILLNEKPVDILAGNDTELFFKVENIEPGKQDLSLEYDDVKATESVNVVDYTLQAGRLNLNRGESTYLNVKVVGLKDLQEPLELSVQNQSVGTILLEGGDIQTIQITPSEVAETGIWQKRFDIQSLRRGSFRIYTDLIVFEENIKETEFPDTDTLVEEIPFSDFNEIEESIDTLTTKIDKKKGVVGSETLTGLGENNNKPREVPNPPRQQKQCLRYPIEPEINNRVGWDLIGDLYVNGKIESDYLNDLRAGEILHRLQHARSLNGSLHTILNEEYFKGHKCNNSTAHADGPQVFPSFPWEDIFLTVDLCDEATEQKTRLIDFLDPNADIEALKKWREDFETAVCNFGLATSSESGTMLNYFADKTSKSMSDIDKAYKEFQEEMRVTLELRYNASRARARMWEGVAFAVGTALTAGIGGAVAGSMSAVLVSSFVSTAGFVYEQGMQSMGMDQQMAQLVSAIATAGMGGGGIFDFTEGVVTSTVTGVVVSEGLNTMAKSNVESFAMSMALLDDDNWANMIKNLEEDYRQGAINRFNENRNNFISDVREELANLCEVKNSLEKLLPETEEAVRNAEMQVRSSFWRKLWNDSMENSWDCKCCEWSDGSSPEPACKQTIPPFGFEP